MTSKRRELHSERIIEILAKSPGMSGEQLAEIILKEVVEVAVDEEKNEWIRAMYPDKKHRRPN